jgi:hypothetical protein
MNVSVGHLFVAGILPGLLIAGVLMANNWLIAVRGLEPMPAVRRSSWPEIRSSFWRSLPALLTPVVILRSMITGLVMAIFSPDSLAPSMKRNSFMNAPSMVFDLGSELGSETLASLRVAYSRISMDPSASTTL